MKDIVWSKAPEWATAIALAGNGRHTIYVGAGQYSYVNGAFDSKVFPIGGTCRWHQNEIEEICLRPHAWNGQGLPPVGIDIEVMHGIYGWIGARVVGYDGEATIIRTNDGYAGVYPHEFRQIRTPEQIAAEEREKAIQQMVKDARPMNRREVCADLYDAGYRKQEQPK